MSEDVTDEYAEDGAVEAAPSSLLDRLRGQLTETKRESHTDLLVSARSSDDLAVWVRYRYMDHAQIQKIQKRFARSKAPDADVVANAVMLATAFMGLFTDEVAGDESQWLNVEALAEVYEVESKRAADVIRALYDGDAAVLAVAYKYMDWLGYEAESVQERASGN